MHSNDLNTVWLYVALMYWNTDMWLKETWVTGSDEQTEIFDHVVLAVRLRLDGGGQVEAGQWRSG